MQVYPLSKSKKLNNLCRDLSRVLNSDSFFEELSKFDGFEYSSDSDGVVDGNEVADAIKYCTIDARVILYRPWWRWSKVNGYFNASKAIDRIYINKYSFDKRDYRSCANTIMHEIIHLVDHWDKERSFSHGSNSPIGKAESAPWKIAKLVVDKFF